MSLTNTQIIAAKPAEKPYKLVDEKGMFLFVTPSGSKLWRLKYRYLGKEKLLALGKYPQVGLKRARELRDDARKQLESGSDPSEIKKTRNPRGASPPTTASKPSPAIGLSSSDRNWKWPMLKKSFAL